MTGPRAAEGGYDYMMQGLAGWMSLTGEPDGPPTKSGLSLVDLSGGYASAIVLLAGLWRARRGGGGRRRRASLLRTRPQGPVHRRTPGGPEGERSPPAGHPAPTRSRA